MNPTGKPSLLIPTTPAKEAEKSATSAADRILAEAKRVAEMPPHTFLPAQEHKDSAEKGLIPVRFTESQTPKFDVSGFINQFEQDALDRKFGHLGVGDYDKLLIERVQDNMDYVPERDRAIHQLITDSVKRYDVKTRNRVNK